MVRIFIATCPFCDGKFQCHSEDLRHKNYDLLCPYCGKYFPQEESPHIEE